jgi:hypothetical protein
MAKGTKRAKRVVHMRGGEIDARAIAIVRGEKQRWEIATAFITDRVSFKMRNLIRTCRKNYYGIFDQPFDQNTNQEKIWYPLTEINVEAVVKNIDLDQKDLNFRAKNPNGFGITDIVRAHVKDKLSAMQFGQMLDDFERQLAIDGTAVWKTYKEYGKMQVRPVDLLNIYIDPTSPSIHQAYRFTERSLMFPEEIMGMSGWRNTKDMDKDVPEGVPQTDPYWMNRATAMNSNIKAWDVYELWGKIPKSLITGIVADENEEVEGHIVVSGIDVPGKETCHLIELNTEKNRKGEPLKPYEEQWYTRVPNRWYGRGIAEKLLTLQIYANIVFNVRINRSRMSQMGLFKIRKGSGITPQMLSRLPSNGAVVMNNLDDLQQFVVQEVGETSYKDEDVINQMSERLTNAFEVVTGEALPSSTPATNAAIQNQNAKSGFSIIKDGIGMFLQRWMDSHALPILADELTAEEIVRIMGNEENFSELVDRVLMVKAQKALDDHYEKGYFPDPQEFMDAVEAARERMMRGDMFVKLVKSIIVDEIDTEVYVTNEDLDVSMTVQNMINMMSIAPEYRDALVKQTFDLLGLGQPKQNSAPIAQAPQQQMPGPAGQGMMPPGGQGGPQGQNPPQSMQSLIQGANTRARVGGM